MQPGGAPGRAFGAALPVGAPVEEVEIDIEAELRRLDAEGRSIDFDEDSKDLSARASQGAICFFFFTQLFGAVTLSSVIEPWYLAYTVLVDVVYAALIRSDPGRLPRKDGCAEVRGEVERIAAMLDPVLQEKQFCRFCRVTRPPRAKHCHKCGCCVAKFDHHCFWIHNCVGAMNHRLFLIFLLMVVPWLFYGTFLTMRYLDANPYFPPGVYLLVTGVGMAAFSVPLLLGHVGAAVLNVTTWEYVKREKAYYLHPASTLADGGDRIVTVADTSAPNPYNRGVCANLRRFCCVATRLPQEDYAPVMLS